MVASIYRYQKFCFRSPDRVIFPKFRTADRDRPKQDAAIGPRLPVGCDGQLISLK